MRIFFVLLACALLALSLASWWTYSSPFSKPAQETVQLNAEKRHALVRLRDETKFEPRDYPPLDYTGIATPEEGIAARATVNDVIEAILARQDGPVAAATVLDLVGQGMRRVGVTAGAFSTDDWRAVELTGSSAQDFAVEGRPIGLRTGSTWKLLDRGGNYLAI